MKKIITFLLLLLTGSAYSQLSNTFKYVIKANGGVEVPVNTFKIGTIMVTRTGTQLNFIDIGSSLQGLLNAKVAVADTAIMLGPYINHNDTIALMEHYTKMNGVQTLTNKTLILPKINEDVELTSTSSNLNVLDGIDPTLEHLEDIAVMKTDAFVNVKDYGAIGDGVTEDRTAIVNAIAACNTIGGTVFFPAGKYLVSTPIVIAKPVHLQGVPVMRFAFPYGNPAGYYEYEAGSVIVSGGSGIAVIKISNPSAGNNEYAASSVSNLHFQDLAGYNDTLLVVKLVSHIRINDCSFTMGACGIKIDARGPFSGDDASWEILNNNNFYYNNKGIYLRQSSVGVPTVFIKGGTYIHTSHQTGIYAESAVYTVIEGLKMDFLGDNATGIDFSAMWGSITDVKMEIDATDTTTVGMFLRTSGIGVKGTGIQFTSNKGIGIKIMGGSSAAYPNVGIMIESSSISSGDIAILSQDYTTGVKINDCDFSGSNTGTTKIRLGGYNHQISNVTANNEMENGGIDDGSIGSSIWNYGYVDGGDRHRYFIVPQIDAYLTDGTPTDSEIDAATSLTPATAKKGYVVTIKDIDGTALLYKIESDGTNWFYTVMTKAL